MKNQPQCRRGFCILMELLISRYQRPGVGALTMMPGKNTIDGTINKAVALKNAFKIVAIL